MVFFFFMKKREHSVCSKALRILWVKGMGIGLDSVLKPWCCDLFIYISMVKQSQKEGMKKLLNKGFYEKKPAVLPNAYWKKSMCLKFTLLFFFQIILMYFFKIKPIAIFFFFPFVFFQNWCFPCSKRRLEEHWVSKLDTQLQWRDSWDSQWDWLSSGTVVPVRPWIFHS